MSSSAPARTGRRRTRLTILTSLVVGGAVLLGVRGYQSSAVSSLSTTSPVAGQPIGHLPKQSRPGDQKGDQQGDQHRVAGAADGVVPDGVTVFDDRYPAVTKLDPALLRALRRAATAAARDGVTFSVDSGWRSRTYQTQLFDQAVSTYGSRGKAARWVAPPGTSAHESGEAVDIGHAAAAAWLAEHGATYGLCQIYRNESWHYELRPAAVHHGCPAQYADPTHDPRIGQ